MTIRAHLRVSSDSQDVAMQRHAIEKWIAAYGNGEPVVWYVEEGVSGDAKERPVFDQLRAESRAGDTVACFALDRLSRDGIAPMLKVWHEFKDKGVRLVSLSESWADSTNPAAEVVIAVLAWSAQQEKRRIKERQRQGIAAAKARGVEFGGSESGWQSKKVSRSIDRIRHMVEQKLSNVEIARATGIHRSTIVRIVKRIKSEAVAS